MVPIEVEMFGRTARQLLFPHLSRLSVPFVCIPGMRLSLLWCHI